jgi:N-acetylglucosaminyl-diphospho-decaprenol L-rhamnosyltransferase
VSVPCPLLVVIVNYKTAALTVKCLETLLPEIRDIDGARVAVVDNASGDGETLTRAFAERGWDDRVELMLAERNGGFAYGNNYAVRPALQGPNAPRYIHLLNSDTEVRPGAVKTLMRFLDENPGVGIAGSSFENLDGSDWPIAFRFITPLSEVNRGLRFGPVAKLLKNHVISRVMEQDRPQLVDWVAGASMMIRREVFEAVGLMDEEYFLYFEEVDFCLQAHRKGWPCWYVPGSRVMHIAGQSTEVTRRDQRPSRTPAYWFASRRHYFRKNYGLGGAITADLAFGLTFPLAQFRRILTRTPSTDPPHLLGDFWKSSVIFAKNRRGQEVARSGVAAS